MMAKKSMAERLAIAREREQRAKAEVRALEAQAAADIRRAETRAKIIIGGAVLARARAREQAAGHLRTVVAALSQRDRDAITKAGVLDGLGGSAGAGDGGSETHT